MPMPRARRRRSAARSPEPPLSVYRVRYEKGLWFMAYGSWFMVQGHAPPGRGPMQRACLKGVGFGGLGLSVESWGVHGSWFMVYGV